jgi:hypothetical protein
MLLWERMASGLEWEDLIWKDGSGYRAVGYADDWQR